MTKYAKKELANDLKNLIGYTEQYSKYQTILNSVNEKDRQELETEISHNKEKVDALFIKILRFKGE